MTSDSLLPPGCVKSPSKLMFKDRDVMVTVCMPCKLKIMHFLVTVYLRNVTGLRGLEGFHEVKAPRFHDTRHKKVVRSSPLRTGRLCPRNILVLNFRG